jgi:hypothetical protein
LAMINIALPPILCHRITNITFKHTIKTLV